MTINFLIIKLYLVVYFIPLAHSASEESSFVQKLYVVRQSHYDSNEVIVNLQSKVKLTSDIQNLHFPQVTFTSHPGPSQQPFHHHGTIWKNHQNVDLQVHISRLVTYITDFSVIPRNRVGRLRRRKPRQSTTRTRLAQLPRTD